MASFRRLSALKVMACRHIRSSLWLALLFAFVVTGMITSCAHPRDLAKETQIKNTFSACKTALLNGQAGQALACISPKVEDYLARLKAGSQDNRVSTEADSVSSSPSIDLFLRTALVRKVPRDLRSHLTLELLLQSIMVKRLVDPRDIEQLDLGRIDISGDHATAELYYQDSRLALSLPFVQEGKDWKIDIMTLLPYAEVLMRLDRAISGKTENQQVELLVNGLPSL